MIDSHKNCLKSINVCQLCVLGQSSVQYMASRNMYSLN